MTYITTTIPYVNARPHIGFALELVQADVLARFRRLRGEPVRLGAGTDDNSLKNVLAARADRADVREFVDRNAEAFLALHGALSVSADDFSDRLRAAARRARRAPQRGARVHRRRPGGLLGVAAGRPGRRVGHPRSR